MIRLGPMLLTALWFASVFCVEVGAGRSAASEGEDATEVVVTRAWVIMGTLFVARFELPWPEVDAGAVAQSVWSAVDEADRLMSSYRPESEISRLEAGGCQRVHPLTARIVGFSHELCESSEGTFDISVRPLLDVWGLRGGKAAVPSASRLKAAMDRTGCGRFRAEESPPCVEIVPGTELDLGGVAKGAALDLARDRLVEQGIAWASLDLGGQLQTIGPGHRVIVLDPRDPARTLAEFAVADESVATSSASERFILIDGRRYGHILDPRTGQPTARVLSATVTHPSALMADALATALFIRGREGVEWAVRKFPGCGILLLESSGENGLLVAGSLEGRAVLPENGR